MERVDRIEEERFEQAGLLHSNLGSSNPVKLVLRHLNAWQTLFCSNSSSSITQADLNGQFNRLIDLFSEKICALEGHTILNPLPRSSNDDGLFDKQAHIQALEGILLHWTRQIQDALSVESTMASETAGVLEELVFQQNRKLNLSSILRQLQTSDVAEAFSLLQSSKSIYLTPFKKLKDTLETRVSDTEQRLTALKSVEDPSKAIAAANFKELKGPLLEILAATEKIWRDSDLFKDPAELAGLLYKAVNELLKRCCTALGFVDIFSPNVTNVLKQLKESSEACEEWQILYEEYIRGETLNGEWQVPAAAFSGRLEASLQRFRELTEVCEAQQQFSGIENSLQFKGSLKAGLSKMLKTLEAQYYSTAEVFQKASGDPVDLSSRTWFAGLRAFQRAVEALEKQLVAAINKGYNTAGDLSSRLRLLPVLQGATYRPAIRQAVSQLTHSFYGAWMEELAAVKLSFESARLARADEGKADFLPQSVAQAYQVVGLRQRLTVLFELHQDISKNLTKSEEAGEVAASVAATISNLSQFLANMHQEWQLTIDNVLTKQLDQPILSQEKGQSQTIAANFSKQLANAFEEEKLWRAQGFSISNTVRQLQADGERLRLLRAQVWSLTSLFNQILMSVEPAHKELFSDRLRYLNKRVSPGVHKLTWTSPKPALDFFFREMRKACKDISITSNAFLAAKQSLETCCASLAGTPLLDFPPKRVFHLSEFEVLQTSHQEQVRKDFLQRSHEMAGIIMELYSCFVGRSPAVQKEWEHFVHKMDQKIEDSLASAVRQGVTQITKCLTGDKRAEVPPLFYATLVMEKSHRLELKPSVQELFHVLQVASRNFQTVLQNVARLPALPTENASKARDIPQGKEEMSESADVGAPSQSFFEAVCGSQKHSQRAAKHIGEGVTGIVDRVQVLLMYWEKKYKTIWETDKDAFIRRYEKAGRGLQSYETDIANYNSLSEEILLENSSETVKFLLLDCNPLKEALINHCQIWISRLTLSLSSITYKEARSLETILTDKISALERGNTQTADALDRSGLVQSIAGWKARVDLVLKHSAALSSHKAVLSQAESTVIAGLLPMLDKLEAILEAQLGFRISSTNQ